MEQEQQNPWEGKRVRIVLEIDGKELFFTADVLVFNSNTITFLDKFGIISTFNTQYIKQIGEVKR